MISTELPRRIPALHSIADLAIIAARAADDKKGGNPLILSVGETVTITDYFVIASGTNRRQVMAIAAGVEEAVREAAELSPVSVEGLEQGSWVLLDYGSFVVHVFLDETREFYDLERLWADSPRLAWADATVG